VAAAVVLEGPATVLAEQVCAERAELGMRLTSDWRAARPGVVCMGEVGDQSAAEQAVLALLAGADVVVTATAPREVVDRMCDDLRRIGSLEHRVEASAGPALSDEERELVERLLAGQSLGQASNAMHLSRRTADRRLAAARRALGVRTTAELLGAADRAGIRAHGS
jgi:DNA-binding NarL/FixJ family response regulator